MQFDHVRGRKLFEVNVSVIGHYSRERVLQEIRKCQLVCANCHAIRTWKRKRRAMTHYSTGGKR